MQFLEYLKQFSSKETIQGHYKDKHDPGSWKKSLTFTVGGLKHEAELSPNTLCGFLSERPLTYPTVSFPDYLYSIPLYNVATFYTSITEELMVA